MLLVTVGIHVHILVNLFLNSFNLSINRVKIRIQPFFFLISVLTELS